MCRFLKKILVIQFWKKIPIVNTQICTYMHTHFLYLLYICICNISFRQKSRNPNSMRYFLFQFQLLPPYARVYVHKNFKLFIKISKLFSSQLYISLIDRYFMKDLYIRVYQAEKTQKLGVHKPPYLLNQINWWEIMPTCRHVRGWDGFIILPFLFSLFWAILLHFIFYIYCYTIVKDIYGCQYLIYSIYIILRGWSSDWAQHVICRMMLSITASHQILITPISQDQSEENFLMNLLVPT